LLTRLINDPDVREGAMDTGLIGRRIDELSRSGISDADRCAAVAQFLVLEVAEAAGVTADHTPWRAKDAFQLGPPRVSTERMLVDGETRSFRVSWPGGNPGAPSVTTEDGSADAKDARPLFSSRHGRVLYAIFDGEPVSVARPAYDATSEDDGHAGDNIRAPINGKVARIFVAEGQAVAKGDRIAVVEAMKMEHVLHAARDGTIAKVAASEGAQVNQGALIASLAEA
jgi:3-methylcrotonyl-CoA carboxylase alpha subunit